jgi:hypothetical protein
VLVKAMAGPKIELPYEIQVAQVNLFDEQNDVFGSPWGDDQKTFPQESTFGKSIKNML